MMRKPGSRMIRWRASMREAFFDHLAATCNISESAAAIGVTTGAVYALRRKDPHFAEQWREALRLGYEMMETLLVGHALSGGGELIEHGATSKLPPIDAKLAIQLLTTRANLDSGRRRRPGRAPGRATMEETDAAILKRLEAIERRRAAAKTEAGGVVPTEGVPHDDA